MQGGRRGDDRGIQKWRCAVRQEGRRAGGLRVGGRREEVGKGECRARQERRGQHRSKEARQGVMVVRGEGGKWTA